MVRKIFGYVGKYKIYAILTPITVALEVLLEILIPFFMANIIDIGVKNGDMVYIAKTGGIMIAMALLALFFGAISGKYSAVASAGLAKNLRSALFKKMQSFSFSNINNFNTASLITRLTTDIASTQHAFMMIIRMLVRSPVMLIGATYMAIKINATLAIIFLIAIPVLGISLMTIAIKAYPRFGVMLKKYDKMNLAIQENLIAIRVVKSFVRGKYEEEKFEFSADDVRKAQVRAEKLIILNNPIMQIVMYTCMICISYFGANMIIAGNMHQGQLMSFISYVTQILTSLMMISMASVMLVMSRASITRINEVLDEEIDIKDDNASENNDVKDGSIEFENVNFSYKKGKNLVLKDINLKINHGETVAIIGGTGSAKTTLVQLIPRLYDADCGSIKIGGIDVKDYKKETLRKNVSMVLQKNVLFSGTILENLKWGDKNATEEEIISVCKDAQAHDFITSFPDGYNTMLGQGGVNVSGGQKQRLCIARALLKKPKILILDDSTSAVDTETDKKIRTAFKKNKDITVIIIAQRISSVIDADKIIVLDDGKINAVGTHETLLSENEIYQEIYSLQNNQV
ncbi:MAG: ABC transporter ATP-binding protein [Ruminococcaceae bacterium]|nr:ABC transporter ATP-binding protein [Oscillospiraceae bacterium]